MRWSELVRMALRLIYLYIYIKHAYTIESRYVLMMISYLNLMFHITHVYSKHRKGGDSVGDDIYMFMLHMHA